MKMGSVFLRKCRCKKCREGKEGHGGVWVIKYRGRNGRIKQESVGRKGVMTKTISKEILNKREQAVKLGQEDMLDADIPTFDKISTEYLQHQRDVKQIRSYTRTAQAVSHFSRLFGDKKLHEITASDVDVYTQRRLKDGKKLNTVVRDLTVIRHLFNYAYSRRAFFGRNPVSESGLPQVNDRKERVLTAIEQEGLLKNSPHELVVIIKLALSTGMRRDEVLFLKWEWVNLQEGFITLPLTHTKSKKSRRVPINAVVRQILREANLESGRPEKGLVFHVSSTDYGSRTWLQRAFKEACTRAGIEGVRFHDLRHTTATRLVEAGIPLHAVAELLGHSSVRMTERYSHPQESVIRATNILANFLPVGDQSGDHKKDSQEKTL
jgi:integrase